MQVFARACASCHGEQGQGGIYDGDRRKPAGAINVPEFLALLSDQALRRLIITGRPDLGMPDCSDGTGPARRIQAAHISRSHRTRRSAGFVERKRRLRKSIEQGELRDGRKQPGTAAGAGSSSG